MILSITIIHLTVAPSQVLNTIVCSVSIYVVHLILVIHRGYECSSDQAVNPEIFLVVHTPYVQTYMFVSVLVMVSFKYASSPDISQITHVTDLI